MKGIRNFIVHIPNKFSDSYETESGLKLYADARWSAKQLANNIAEVIETPFMYDGPVKKGMRVFMDPTVVLNQVYKGVAAESPHLVDRENMLFKVSESMVLMYSHGEGTKWNGHNNNALLEPIETTNAPSLTGIIIPGADKKTFAKDKRTVLIGNELLEEEGVHEGDTVFINPMYAVDVYLRGKKYSWMRNKFIVAKELKEDAA